MHHKTQQGVVQLGPTQKAVQLRTSRKVRHCRSFLLDFVIFIFVNNISVFGLHINLHFKDYDDDVVQVYIGLFVYSVCSRLEWGLLAFRNFEGFPYVSNLPD